MTAREAVGKAKVYRELIASLYDTAPDHTGVKLDISDAIDNMDNAIAKLHSIIDNEQETS